MRVADFGKSFPFFSGSRIEEMSIAVAAAAEHGLPIGRERKRADPAVAAIPESAKFLAGSHFPQPGEIAVLLAIVTTRRHEFAIRRKCHCVDGIIMGKIADLLAALNVEEMDDLAIG